ncbi:MAG TPA: cysteine desulfurase-like protein [Anaerolineae bacterium]|nr:cysteine desulfurase-like protein [Anaerolineae bacterium]
MPIDERAVGELREEFPALHFGVGGSAPIFLDGPGGTQVHGSVLAAIAKYLTEANSNSGGQFSHSRRTDATVLEARRAMADLLNAHRPDEIAFGPNMTTLAFQLSRAIGRTIRPGDEVVVTRLDHDANVAPWRALDERGAVIQEVDFRPDDCTLDMESLEAAISPRTKLLAIGYASNAVGTINPVREVVQIAHRAGARVFVDAVHYVPHAPIDVQALGCDWLACSAYKFFGPHMGVLYGRHELMDALPAYKVRPAHDEPPHKLETGTLSFEGLAGVTAAVEYLASVGRRFGAECAVVPAGASNRRLELVAGMAAIRSYEWGICRQLIEGLAEIRGLRVYGITDPARFSERVPTVSFTLSGVHPREVARRLGEQGIYVWDGNFYALSVTERLGLEELGGLVRVGPVHYNTPAEIDRLLEALAWRS